MKRKILGLIGAMVLTAAPAIGDQPEVRQAVVEVNGMSCSACAYRLEKVLRKLPDAKSAKVDLNKEQATVTFSGDAKVTDATIKETIRQAGFAPGKLEWRAETQKSGGSSKR